MPRVTTLGHVHTVVEPHSFNQAKSSIQGVWLEHLGAGQYKEATWRCQVLFNPCGGDSKRFHPDLQYGQLSGRLSISEDLASPEETDEILDWRNHPGEEIVLDDMLGAGC